MVSERGIEADPYKIRAILDMPAPRTKREVKGFLGRLQYISKFIARLIDICESIFRLLRKSQPTVWDDQCQRAFERIREYLLSPPVLVPPTPGCHLLLYLSISDVALGCMLAQLNDSSKERAIYYLSKRMLDYETRPALVGRLMRWLVLLTEFDIHFITQKSIRWSIVADHLASLPVFDGRAINDDFPDKDVAIVTSLSDRHPTTNNIVKYEACILGLETTLELGIRQMEVFGDSNLNQFVDALTTLASMIDIPTNATVCPLLIDSRSILAYYCLIDNIELDDGLSWYYDIYHFLRLGVYPKTTTTKDKRALRQLAARFMICGETLYRRLADGMLLLCLDRASADRVMREVHARVYGPHMGGHMLARKIMRTGYFWLTMEMDYCQFV
ncbi:hypothetical protein VitviT2T_015701 [Vitis vinifera]|uniref:Reverse transcriptase/retrotransposon-derived protein RNase H-like domain-containing protein n=1 Tax=Vitis vinifera TaxID=29760 RepID=A0ABY9CPG8_VITVI|nr:hypothetical protein VitviT2T_015701 [Vitis vinifera]